MSVVVSVCGANKQSDEYQAALKLEAIIHNSLPSSVAGEIVLFANATLMGQTVKDVDLMMIGQLQNYSLIAEFNYKSEGMINENVKMKSFCTTIEIKRHDISGIVVNGTDFYVYYGKEKHSVTLQSNNQKISAMNFFKSVISYTPYITNVIWFTQATQNEVNGLCAHNGRHMISNVIGREFKFNELMQLLIYQHSPFKTQKEFVFDSNSQCSVNDIRKALDLFSRTKEQMGEMTRRKIEQITSKAFNANAIIDTEEKVSIYRGRAGTGKTVGLIQTAIKLVDDEQVRVLILTYNKALVSDIRRLFALAELPDMFEVNCVHISTMHSYFFRLANKVIYQNQLKGDKFLERYDYVLKSLIERMSDTKVLETIKKSCREDSRLDWDYILIDEAQDWSDQEKNIILRLFEKGKIIVADGGQQFVRNINVCDWSVIRERNNIKLKYCLRQKENLVAFLNVYTNKWGILGGKILTKNNLPGGKIIITDDNNVIEIHKTEIERLKKAGNIPYDMLYLVPHSLVKKQAGISFFAKKKEFEEHGIYVWDGTCYQNRDIYSINGEEIRILPYESSRGLEGWTVVCMDFDAFLDEKADEYEDGDVNKLLLESPDERRKKYLYNWAMIPLTRAIDTLIITLKDKESSVGILLKEIADENSDIVTWL